MVGQMQQQVGEKAQEVRGQAADGINSLTPVRRRRASRYLPLPTRFTGSASS